MPWTVNLTNSQLNGQVSSALADGSYTYQEVLSLLETVATGGVSASEWGDLKTVYSNSQALFASDYVQTITYNVVYGNLANAKWWGGAKTYGGVATLGDMSASTSQTNAERLIDKWFLGLDLPMPIAGGDTATGKAATGVYTYAVTNGALFVNGTTPADVNQGAAGDCYYVATLGSVANASPSVISNALIDNGNGTYGVKFYLNGVAAYTTVNKSVPTDAGSVAFASNSSYSLNGETWVSLLEKAFVQLNTQADVDDRGADWVGENSYQAVEGGWASPIKMLTNLSYKYYSSYYNGIPDAYASGEFVSTNAQTYKQTIINALNAGSIGWLGSFGDSTSATNGKQNFVSGHAFMLLGYNAGTDKFIVRNPWGGDGSRGSASTADDYNPQFEASITEFWNSSVKGVVAISDAASAAPVFTYTASTAASNSGTAATEGAAVTFTITRSASGAASTVYVSTTTGSASDTDYQPLNKQAVDFSAYETSKTVTVGTNADSLSEGSESFGLAVYKQTTDTTSVATATAFIKDPVVSNNFSYTVASSAANAASAVAEGSAVTFTVTRSGSGSASTVYLSTSNGSTSNGDYQGLSQSALSFAAYETSKTVTVSTLQDTATEGNEYFSLDVYKNIGDTSQAGSAQAHIKDVYLPSYNYTITSNAASPATAVTEGNKVSFTITRSGSGTASTVYVSTADGSAGAPDYVGISQKAITFAANEKIATLDIEVNQDWWLEADEYFALNLYKNLGDASYASSGSAFIKDNPVASYNYSISSNAGSGAPVTEGSAVTFTVTRSGSGTASSVYLSTGAGSATSNDFLGLNQSELSFTAYETTKTVTVSTYTDGLVEGDEYFWLNLYRNVADSSYTTYAPAYIKDQVETTDYTYEVTSNAQTVAVTEGGAVTFTITRSGSGSASTVYWGTEAGTASAGAGDYESLGIQTLNFAAYETSKTVTVNTYADTQTEAEELFWLNIYKTYADATEFNYAAYGYGYIQDPAVVVTNYDYTITSSADYGTPVAEGGAVTFTVTRNGSGTAASVYVSTSAGSAGASDFEGLSTTELKFSAFETSKTVTVNTYTDSLTEGSEYFWLDLYKSYADVGNELWSSYGAAYIKDPAAVVANYNYSISSSASTTPVTEGGTVTFTVTRSGSGSASVVYLSTYVGTAGVGDYQGLDKVALNFAANETSKTVTVNTHTDSLLEGEEYFYLELFKSYADALNFDWTEYALAMVKDPAAVANYSYSVASSAQETAVTEGGTVTFTITRSGSGSASTVYWDTEAGTASAAGGDYQGAGATALSFAANETSKTVTIKTYTDSLTEGTEYFWLNVYKTYADAVDFNWDAYASALIVDAAVTTNYTYTITNSTSNTAPVAEGGTVTFTVTRSGSGSASDVYLSTYKGTADVNDYQSLYATTLSFAANETSKTVTLATYTDSVVEGTEYFYLELFKTYADAINYDWTSWSAAYVKDAVVSSNYSYTITSSANNLNAPATEGATVTFTIQRSGSGSASTVYLSTSDGTTDANDFQALSLSTLTFAANETTKTVTVKTYADNQTEYVELFWLDLYKSYADALNDDWASYGSAYIDDFGVGSAATGLSANKPAGVAQATSLGDVPGLGASATANLSQSFPGHSLKEFNNDYAFAALAANGSVMAWGQNANGGELGSASSALNGDIDVTHIYSNNAAFAALRADGSVVSWGNASAGGDSSAVAAALNGTLNVTQVFSTETAFAALREDGSVVTWGDLATGGDSSAVASKLNGDLDVSVVYSNMNAFAALRTDGSVVTWGFDLFGGNSSAVASQLSGTMDVTEVVATGSAFAAVRTDGSVVSWGSAGDGGNSSALASGLNGDVDVRAVCASSSAFAALRVDGSVLSWGDVNNGGDSSAVADQLNGSTDVSALASTQTAFAALRTDGSVVTWGNAEGGGNSSAVASALDGSTDVTRIYANGSAFAALRSDGSVVSWGYGAYGGDQSAVAGKLDGSVDVQGVVANDHAFAALRLDGSVVTWGSLLEGGDSTAVQSKLDGTVDVSQIYASSSAFAALRADGTVVTWGNQDKGGDSSAVAANLTSIKNLTGDLLNAWAVTIDPNIYGSGGNDKLTSTSASETIDGGAGIDTVIYAGNRSSYTLKPSGGDFTVAGASGSPGTDTLVNVERIEFADKKIALDLDASEHGGQALEFIGLVVPSMIQTPSAVGVIMGLFDQGQTMLQVCQLALDVGLVTSIAGSNTNEALAAMVFRNFFDREADAATIDVLASFIDGRSASYSQAEFMAILAGFGVNQEHIGLVGLQQTGIEYI